MSQMSDVEAVDALALKFKALKSEIAKVIVGQDEAVELVLTSIFSNFLWLDLRKSFTLADATMYRFFIFHFFVYNRA